jgi:hypothetical protein
LNAAISSAIVLQSLHANNLHNVAVDAMESVNEAAVGRSKSTRGCALLGSWTAPLGRWVLPAMGEDRHCGSQLAMELAHNEEDRLARRPCGVGEGGAGRREDLPAAGKEGRVLPRGSLPAARNLDRRLGRKIGVARLDENDGGLRAFFFTLVSYLS